MHFLAQLLASTALAVATPADLPSMSTVGLAIEVGITPESLVVSGFSTAEIATLVDNMGTAAEAKAALASVHAAVETKAAALAAAEAALRASPGDGSLAAACDSARADLAEARSTLSSLRGSIRESLLADSGQTKRDAVTLYVSGAGRSTPPEFKAVSRTDAEWTALEAALRAEARASRQQTTLSSSQAELLAAARSASAVRAAKARLDECLATATAAFAPAPPQ